MKTIAKTMTNKSLIAVVIFSLALTSCKKQESCGMATATKKSNIDDGKKNVAVPQLKSSLNHWGGYTL